MGSRPDDNPELTDPPHVRAASLQDDGQDMMGCGTWFLVLAVVAIVALYVILLRELPPVKDA